MKTYREARRVSAACLTVLLLAGIVAACALLSAVWPEASGEKRIQKGSLIVDASHASQGYIEACASSKKKLKLRITKGDTTYTYDLNNKGDFEVFPLQMGSGDYICELYQNVKGNKYSKDAQVKVNARLETEYAAFLCPSQYVNYTQTSAAVAASEEICAGLQTDREKVAAIRDYMTRGFTYDYVRALSSPSSYLGDVERCFKTRSGLCQDLAVVAACMLRVQGIPTQLVIGYAGKVYHAWNNVLIDGEYQRLDITAELSGFDKNTVYTAERYY